MPTALASPDFSVLTSFPIASDLSSNNQEVIELSLLLPEWQVSALEEESRRRGMTIGQFVRKTFSELFPRTIEPKSRL
jgi:hypothetical protein